MLRLPIWRLAFTAPLGSPCCPKMLVQAAPAAYQSGWRLFSSDGTNSEARANAEKLLDIMVSV
eukprot:1158077-Pelagomonas_calceolata.AAC.6